MRDALRRLGDRRVNGLGFAAFVLALSLVGGVVACAAGTARADPPKPKGWQVIHYPDNGSLYTFCDHGNRLYLSFVNGGHSVAVAANDPTCAEVPK